MIKAKTIIYIATKKQKTKYHHFQLIQKFGILERIIQRKNKRLKGIQTK